MNKQPRFINFSNVRNNTNQNSRTYDIHSNTQIIQIYKTTSDTKLENINIELNNPINIDCYSEIKLESIQVTTMNHHNDTSDTTSNNDYISIKTLGFVIDIDEFNIKSYSNYNELKDKIFIPYTNYNVNITSTVNGSGTGFQYYNNSAPTKNNFLCNTHPKRISQLNLTVKRLESNTTPGGDPTLVDLFANVTDEMSSSGTNNGGDIMLVISVTNLPNYGSNQNDINSIFMDPQNNLMNIPNEYELFKLQQENKRNQNTNNQQNINF